MLVASGTLMARSIDDVGYKNTGALQYALNVRLHQKETKTKSRQPLAITNAPKPAHGETTVNAALLLYS